MHKVFKTGLALIGMSVAACATGPTVIADKDLAIDLSHYKTFAFFTPLATDRNGYGSLISTHLKQATRAQLESRGYAYDDQQPDLRVNFFLNVNEKQELRSSPAAAPAFYGYRVGRYGAWVGYPYNVETVNYEFGTLSVDLVDVHNKSLVWQGIAKGKLYDKARKDPAASANNAVVEIFRQFPVSAVR